MVAWAVAVLVAAGPGPELHVVGLYEAYARAAGGEKIPVKAQVAVNRPGKDVTLVLSAYEPVTWQVVAGPRTRLTKVVLGGSKRQAAEVPKGVEVVDMFGEGREGLPRLSAYYKADSARLRPTVQAIHRLTGLEVASYQGAYNYDWTKPFLVNAVQNDERLRSDFPRAAPADQLPKLSFRATHLTPLDRISFSASFGDFTRAGPDKDSLKPLPNRVLTAVQDPAGKRHYGLALHDIVEIDLAKGTGEKLDPGPGVPRVSWPAGITYDTKRDRLVVATVGGEGHLYTYAPKTGAWAAVSLNNIDLAALAYHPKDDTLYGLAGERGGDGAGRSTLFRFNSQGAVVGQTPLAGPMFPGVLGSSPNIGTRVQLVSTGDHLAALVTGVGGRDENGAGGKSESFLFLIDPKTDQVKLAWKE